jgi:hypothetical protein
MEFTHNGKRHLVSWQHVDESRVGKVGQAIGVTAALIQSLQLLPKGERERMGVPHKVSRRIDGKLVSYDGYTVCRIRTLKDNAAELEPQDRWDVVAEGYSFKRSDEKYFNKSEGRRHSMGRAIRGAFNLSVRTAVWDQFNATWPPVSPESTMWEKRYVVAQQEIKQLNKRIVQLNVELNKALRGSAVTEP